MTRALPHVEGVEHRFVELPGRLKVHVAEAGAGPPVLALHGWPQHWWSWREVIPRLADAHRLVMPDLRGFGWSEAPGRGYDPETFAADALALLDALGLERVAVIGHDWGGFSAQLLALRHPERVSALLVCNAPQPWPRLSGRLVSAGARAWYVLVLAAPSLGPWLVQEGRFPAWLLRRGGRPVPTAADFHPYRQMLAEPEHALATMHLYRAYLRLGFDSLVARRYDRLRLTVPTRVLFGREDPYIPVAFLDGLEAHGDDVQVELVPDCGHWTLEERPDLVAARARTLFSALDHRANAPR